MAISPPMLPARDFCLSESRRDAAASLGFYAGRPLQGIL